jgi:hypothetical protein
MCRINCVSVDEEHIEKMLFIFIGRVPCLKSPARRCCGHMSDYVGRVVARRVAVIDRHGKSDNALRALTLCQLLKSVVQGYVF